MLRNYCCYAMGPNFFNACVLSELKIKEHPNGLGYAFRTSVKIDGTPLRSHSLQNPELRALLVALQQQRGRNYNPNYSSS